MKTIFRHFITLALHGLTPPYGDGQMISIALA
jgi:hypothetical protein